MGRAAQSLRQSQDGTPTRELLGLHTSSVLHRHLCGQKGGVSTTTPAASPFEPSILLNAFNLQPTVQTVGGKGAKGQEHEPLMPHAVYSDDNNPITGEAERYMLFSFSSPYDGAGLTEHGRPQIDLCVVVDTSACMGWALDADASGTLAAFSQVSEHTPSRLTAAQRAVEAIVSQLNDQDRIALVSYTGDAKIDCRLAPVNNAQRNACNDAFRALKTQDRPHSTKGLRMGLEVLGSAGALKAQGMRGSKGKGKASGLPSPPRVRRVIIITGSPFDGREAKCFGDMVEKAAKPSSGSPTYTTVVTLGVDLHLDMIQRLSSVPGCRYVSAYAPFELTEHLTNPFFHHACPVATNVKVDLTGAWGVASAYGSPVFGVPSSPSSSTKRSSSSSSTSRSLVIPSETAEPVPVLGRVYLLKLTPSTGAETTGSSATRMFAAVRDTVSEYLQMQPKRSSRSNSSSSSEQSSSAISVSVRYNSPIIIVSNGAHGQETEVVVQAVEAQEDADVRKAVVLVRLAEAIRSYAIEAVEMESLPRDERRSRRTEAFRKLQDFRSWVLKELKTAEMPTDKGKMKGLLKVLDQLVEVDGRELGVVVAGGGPGNGGASRGGVSKKAAIREQVSCVVCFEVLEEATQLPCLHTFCRACIETLPAATAASIPGNPKPASKKKRGSTTTATYRQCPSCRTPFLDPDDLKSNFQLQAIANLLRDEDSGNESFDTDEDDTTDHTPDHKSAAEETTATTTTTATTITTTTHATGPNNVKSARAALARAAAPVARGGHGSTTTTAAASSSAAIGSVTADTTTHNNVEEAGVPASSRGKRKAGGKGVKDGGRNKKSG